MGLIVLILNLVWELMHYRLYIDLTGIPPTIHLMLASFMDLLLVSLIFLAYSAVKHSTAWIENPRPSDFLVIVILAAAVAAGIEVYSLSQGRWIYEETMPTILGIGLSPLIQLFTTFIISLWLFKITKIV